MSKAKTAKEVLVAAKWILENYGWCQGAARRDKRGRYINLSEANQDTSFCALGALNAVDADYNMLLIANRALLPFLPHKSSLVCFNDNVLTKKSDIISMFNSAIKSLKE